MQLRLNMSDQGETDSTSDEGQCCTEDYVYLVNDSLFDIITVFPDQIPSADKPIDDVKISIIPISIQAENYHRVLKEPPQKPYGRDLLTTISLMLA